eukprot:393911-Rhodomonas_salina.1
MPPYAQCRTAYVAPYAVPVPRIQYCMASPYRTHQSPIDQSPIDQSPVRATAKTRWSGPVEAHELPLLLARNPALARPLLQLRRQPHEFSQPPVTWRAAPAPWQRRTRG